MGEGERQHGGKEAALNQVSSQEVFNNFNCAFKPLNRNRFVQ